MNGLAHDIRYTLRSLARTPGFTALVILTLAVGIGASTAIFSVVDRVLLRPAPFENADQLVMVWETDRNSATTHEPASLPDFLDFRERSTQFAHLAAFLPAELNSTPPDGEPARLTAIRISDGFLPLAGIQPLAGRAFTADESRPGGPPAAMISEELWERRYGRDPAVAGQTLYLNDTPVTITGVLPAETGFGILQILSAADYGRGFADRGSQTDIDLWVPLAADPERFPRETHPIFVLGRLAPGATVASAQQEMSSLATDLEAAFPENAGRGVYIQPLPDVVLSPVRPALLIVLGAVVLVLLIACANVANLLLVRAIGRAREVAVRSALGAGRARLARQFLVESLILTVVAAAAGVVLAWLSLDLLLALAPAGIARISEVAIDGRVLGLTLLVTLIVGTGFGMVPVLQSRRIDLQSALKGRPGRGSTGGREHHRFRSGLVIAEVALAVVLLVGAGLLIKSFWRLVDIDPGFQTEGVLKAEFQLPQSRYPADFSVWPDFREMHRFNAALLAEVATLPGVEAAAIAGNHPLDAGFTNSFAVVGRESEAAEWPEISIRRVTPEYFRVTGLSLLDGRLIGAQDATDAPAALLINQTAARRFFADREPVGQQIALWGEARTIVGVVADEKFHGLAEATPPAVYAPLAQVPSVNGAEVLLVRTGGNPLSVAPAVRRAIQTLDPALAIFGVEALETTVLRSVADRRFIMLLLGAFAALALLLAVVGVHGVLSYAVYQRKQEIGIRVALGAPAGRIVGTVVRNALVLATTGIGLGLAGAWAVTRVLSSILYGVSATDAAVFASVPLILILTALLAAYLPARRAARVDPMVALRAE